MDEKIVIVLDLAFALKQALIDAEETSEFRLDKVQEAVSYVFNEELIPVIQAEIAFDMLGRQFPEVYPRDNKTHAQVTEEALGYIQQRRGETKHALTHKQFKYLMQIPSRRRR